MRGLLHRPSFIVVMALIVGFVAALVGTLGIFAGAQEHSITGAALIGFALGWAVLALASIRFTDQPQKWAYVPAVYMALAGLALLMLAPGDHALSVLSWMWPPVVLALVVWMVMQSRQHLKSWTRRGLLYPLFVVLALMAIGSLTESAIEATQQTKPSTGQVYAVGKNSLYLSCSGTGSPTVVLVNGYSENSSNWAWVKQSVAQKTRVCVYDRAGEGWSKKSGTETLNGKEQVKELDTLLTNAKVPGPYVLAGHSIGGTYALLFAHTYPQKTAGIVLLDSSTPEQFKFAWYPGLYSALKRAYALFPSLSRIGVARIALGTAKNSLPAEALREQQNFASTATQHRSERDEWVELPTTFNDAKQLKSLDGKPLYVLTAGKGQMDGWFAAQDKLATLSSNSAHTMMKSSTHEALLANKATAASSSKAIVAVVIAAQSNQQLNQF